MILVDNTDFRNPRLTLLCFELGICKHSLFLDYYYLLLLLPRSIFIGIGRKLFWTIPRTVPSLKMAVVACSQPALRMAASLFTCSSWLCSVYLEPLRTVVGFLEGSLSLLLGMNV